VPTAGPETFLKILDDFVSRKISSLCGEDYGGLWRTFFLLPLSLCLSQYIYVYIYMYIVVIQLLISLLYDPTLTSMHDYWKNHSFDYTDFVGKVMSLLFNMLSRFVLAFLPRNKHLLISWLQSLYIYIFFFLYCIFLLLSFFIIPLILIFNLLFPF